IGKCARIPCALGNPTPAQDARTACVYRNPAPNGIDQDAERYEDRVIRPCDNARFAEKPAVRMALKSTIYKVDLQIADMDRHY
ncbi:YaeQ family protein, partial [Vibrio astriarenae]